MPIGKNHNPRPYKDQRAKHVIKDLAQKFFAVESNRSSLVTVTDVDLYDRGKRANIMLSVLPDNKRDQVLKFAKRQNDDFREYIKKNTKLGIIPFFDFKIDIGEINRQNIDKLI